MSELKIVVFIARVYAVCVCMNLISSKLLYPHASLCQLKWLLLWEDEPGAWKRANTQFLIEQANPFEGMIKGTTG
jgi:hypothetical protein